MSTCTRASIGRSSFADRWKPQAQCWGSRYGTPPPTRVSLMLSLGVLHPPTPPPHLLLPSRKSSLSVAQAGPRTWLQAVEALVCQKTNPALPLTQSGSKHICSINPKTTRLPAVKHYTYGYVGILHEHSDVFVSSTVVVLLYFECDISKIHTGTLQEAAEDIRTYFSLVRWHFLVISSKKSSWPSVFHHEKML